MVFKGRHGLVWNPAEGRAYRFTDGKYETTDPVEIAYLKSIGTAYEGADPEATEPTTIKKNSKKGQA